MPWTHGDFARMHYLYGMYDGDAQAAATAFRDEYVCLTRYIDPPKPEDFDANLIFPTSVDIIRIHKMYERGELPNENTITGKRMEGERIFFSHSEEMKWPVYDKFKRDRLEACQALLKKCEDDESFYDNVLWTSTAEVGCNLFCAIGYEKYYQTDHDDGKDVFFNVWMGMLAGQVIGPVEMPAVITDEVYAKFLEEDLPELLEDVPVNIRKKLWVHVEVKYVGDCVTKFLNENYEDRWIGPEGPIIWPILGWDLNPVHKIWGFVIENVYRDKCESKEEIMERVIIGCDQFELFERVTENKIFANIKLRFMKFWEVCIEEKGAEANSWYLY